MSTRQMIVTIAAMTLLVSCLVWFFGSREMTRFHFELRDYLDKMDKFRDWEAQGGNAD